MVEPAAGLGRVLETRACGTVQPDHRLWRPGLDYLYYCLDETADPVTSLDSSVLRALATVMPESPVDAQGVLRRVVINEQQYRQGVDALTAEQQQVETGLLTSLTRQTQTIGR